MSPNGIVLNTLEREFSRCFLLFLFLSILYCLLLIIIIICLCDIFLFSLL